MHILVVDGVSSSKGEMCIVRIGVLGGVEKS